MTCGECKISEVEKGKRGSKRRCAITGRFVSDGDKCDVPEAERQEVLEFLRRTIAEGPSEENVRGTAGDLMTKGRGVLAPSDVEVK